MSRGKRKVWVVIVEEEEGIEVYKSLDSVWTSKKGAFARAQEIIGADSRRRYENRRSPIVESLHLNRAVAPFQTFEFYYDGSVREV